MKKTKLKKRILVTGSNGFVGSNLVKELIKRNYEIHVLLRKNSNFWRIKNVLKYCKVHYVDLSDSECTKQIIKKIKPEIVYHCATYGVSHLQNNFETMIQTNILGTFNLLNSLQDQNNLKHLINVGTSLEYGSKKGSIKENDRENPNTLYGISKLAQTRLVLHYAENLPVTALRVFTSYGQFEEPNHLIGDIMLGIISKKPIKIKTLTAKRDFIHINDITNALIKIGMKKPCKGVLNIGTGKEYSVKDIIMISKKIGKIKIIHDKKFSERARGTGYADLKKSQKILKWRSEITIEDGLKITHEWFEKNMKYYSEN